MSEMTWADVAREYFPGADAATLDYIIWNRTGFPSFWDTGGGKLTVEQVYRSQLQHYKDALSRGVRLCELCNREARSKRDEYLCHWCYRHMYPTQRIKKKQQGATPKGWSPVSRPATGSDDSGRTGTTAGAPSESSTPTTTHKGGA